MSRNEIGAVWEGPARSWTFVLDSLRIRICGGVGSVVTLLCDLFPDHTILWSTVLPTSPKGRAQGRHRESGRKPWPTGWRRPAPSLLRCGCWRCCFVTKRSHPSQYREAGGRSAFIDGLLLYQICHLHPEKPHDRAGLSVEMTPNDIALALAGSLTTASTPRCRHRSLVLVRPCLTSLASRHPTLAIAAGAADGMSMSAPSPWQPPGVVHLVPG